jgi:bacterioferritin-associated ferredoxin
MIICHCHRTSDREIRQAAAEGASDCNEVAKRCLAGGACGSCRLAVEAILRSERREQREVLQKA